MIKPMKTLITEDIIKQTASDSTKPKILESKVTESTILHDIFVYLYDLHIGKVIRHNTGGYKLPNGKYLKYGEKGHSDLSLELANQMKNIYIEVKTPKGKPTEDQLAFLEYQKQRGHMVLIAHSVDEVRDFLIKNNIINNNILKENI